MSLTAEQLTALNSELTNDPLGRGYASMDDQAAAEDMNLEYRDYSKDISIFRVEQLMRSSGVWDNYSERARAPQGLDNTIPGEWRAAYPAMREFMSMFIARMSEIDFRAHPNRIAKEGNFIIGYGDDLLARCEAEGSVGTNAAEAARAECDTMVSRAWELVDQQVTAQDVIDARALS